MKHPKEYTVENHVEVLEIMMRCYDVCDQCPAEIVFPKILYKTSLQWICPICTEFIGLEDSNICPCNRLGKEEAIKTTIIALNNYYSENTIPTMHEDMQ